MCCNQLLFFVPRSALIFHELSYPGRSQPQIWPTPALHSPVARLSPADPSTPLCLFGSPSPPELKTSSEIFWGQPRISEKWYILKALEQNHSKKCSWSVSPLTLTSSQH